ncbi:hypothetical protein FFLO_06982 [Filobasidium floriforme]|uniref:DNA 3'-5' helicase n=1 Tax=Filobasidium floriforme TaxID=5210 RepID=A0A8K0JE71_9TREE|nr:hypothetical protein FFLO_06982 [Filobasidium floriforme]
MMRTIDSILTRQCDVLAIYPTGSGKSMLMWIPAALEGGMTMVYISLFSQLGTDIVTKGTKLGLRCEWWTTETALSSAPQVLVVPVEAIHSNKFRALIDGLYKVDRLSRFVLDEAHVLRSQGNFRTQFDGVMRFRSSANLVIPWVLLTATLPPTWEAPLLHEVGSDAGCTLRVRTLADRPNLQYCQELPPRRGDPIEGYPNHQGGWKQYVCDKASQICETSIQSGGSESRVIIYCPVKAWIETFAQALDKRNSDQRYTTSYKTAMFLADMTHAEKQEVVASFINGTTPIVVATSAFGQGIDHAHVRTVILIGEPWNMLDVAQQAGRAGRDGQPAKVFLFPSYGLMMPNRDTNHPRANILDPQANERVQELFGMRGKCLRRQINRYLEEVNVPSCLEGTAATQLCSVCMAASQAEGMRPKLFLGARAGSNQSRPRQAGAGNQVNISVQINRSETQTVLVPKENTVVPVTVPHDRVVVSAKTPTIHRYVDAKPCSTSTGIESTGGKVVNLQTVTLDQTFSLGSPWKPAPVRPPQPVRLRETAHPNRDSPAPIIRHIVHAQQARVMAENHIRAVPSMYQEWIGQVTQAVRLRPVTACGYCYVDFGFADCFHGAKDADCPVLVARDGCRKCGEGGHLASECPMQQIKISRSVKGVVCCYL